MMNILKKIWQWLFGKPPKTVQVDAYGEERNNLPVFDNPPAPPPIMEQPKRVGNRKVRRMPKVYADKLSGKYPPRSMTDREKELYAIKPNLQYWVNKGEL